jgi:hypothetical protein
LLKSQYILFENVNIKRKSKSISNLFRCFHSKNSKERERKKEAVCVRDRTERKEAMRLAKKKGKKWELEK